MSTVTVSLTGGCCDETPASSAALDGSKFLNSTDPAWSIHEDYEDIDYFILLDGQSGVQSVSSLLTSTALTTSPVYPGYVQVQYTAGQPLGARSFGQLGNAFVAETMLGWKDLVEYDTTVSGPRQSETIMSALGNQVHKEILAKAGKRIRIKIINGAEGGTLIEQIRRGTNHWNNFRDAVKQGIDATLAAGRRPFIMAAVLGVGYTNTQGAQTTDRVGWAEWLKWYHRELNEDLLPMTARVDVNGILIDRQEVAIPLIVSQVRDTKGTLSVNALWTQINPTNTPQQGDELTTRLADGIYMAGPIYQYPTWPNPGLHLTSIGYRSYGCDLGHAVADIFMGNRWTALRWAPEDTRWRDSQTVRLYYRRPNTYVEAATYTVSSITDDVATITGTSQTNRVLIGQRITGGTVPNDIEEDTFTFGPTDDDSIGGNGTYYVTESQTKTGPITATAVVGIGPPNYYRGGVMIDDTGTYMATTDWTVTKGFTAWDGEGRYLDFATGASNELEIQSVKRYRPDIDVTPAFIDIRFTERPTGPIILTYGMKPRMFNSVTSVESLVAGSGGTNGTYALIVTGGSVLSGASAAAGTFRVQGGALVEVTFTENTADGIIGGLYTTETLPILDFTNAPGLTGASAVAVFTSTSGGGVNRGIGGLLRDDTAWGYDAGNNPRFNWAVQQFQVLPPPPYPAPNLLKNGRGLIHTRRIAATTYTATISGTTMTVSAMIGPVAIAVGQSIEAGTGVPPLGIFPGTTILSQLTGAAGDVGTYSVSISQTVTPGLTVTSYPSLQTGGYGHDRWYANVQGTGAIRAIPTSTVDADGEAFMVITTNTTASRRVAYAQQLTNADTINLRNRRVAFGGRIYREDATATNDNDIALGIIGWTGTADAMPWAFINEYGSTVLDLSMTVTASIAATTMDVTAVLTGRVAVGQELTVGAAAGTLILEQLTGTAHGVGTYRVSISQTVASTTITGTALFVANASFVPIASEVTIVEPTGGKTDTLVVSGVIPSNVTNIAFYAFTLQGMPYTDRIGLALKAEVGNTISGFPVQTTYDAKTETNQYYQVFTVRLTVNDFWLSWPNAPLVRTPNLSYVAAGGGTVTAVGETIYGAGMDDTVSELVTLTVNAEIGA